MLPYRVTKDVIERLIADKETRVFLFGAGKVECEMLSSSFSSPVSGIIIQAGSMSDIRIMIPVILLYTFCPT